MTKSTLESEVLIQLRLFLHYHLGAMLLCRLFRGKVIIVKPDGYNFKCVMGEHFWPIVWTVLLNLCQVSMQLLLKLLSSHISIQYVLSIRSFLLLLINSIFIFNSPDYNPDSKPLRET